MAHFENRTRLTLLFATAFLTSLALFTANYAAFLARYQPPVRVRWSEAVTPSTREALETRYGLTAPTYDTGQSWSYELANPSSDNIRQLVQDPAVADTHNIDRSRFRLSGDEHDRPLHRPRWFPVWSAGIGAAVVLLALWFGEDRLSRLARMLGRSARVACRAAPSVMTRGIPDLSAEALGVFRVAYAIVLIVALRARPLTLTAGYIPDDGQLGWLWVGWLASRPDLMALLERAILALLIFFAIGLLTRTAYVLIAAGMTVWILVWIESQHSNAHTYLAMFLTIPCLIPVRWGDALSVDERIRRRRGSGYGAGLHGKAYGYAVWIPGLALGTIWVSAANAKLQDAGLDWILGGAVKYHWVFDAESAPVDWGLWVASHHWAAVIMSFCGVFFEVVFILSVFASSTRWRLMLASTGLALLTGFHLFNGAFFWPWGLVFAMFAIPWGPLVDVVASRIPKRSVAIDAAAAAGLLSRRRDLRPVHFVLIALLCIHAMLRLPAGFGRFGSYSHTYASTDEFDRTTLLDPVDHLWLDYGTAGAVEVDADDLLSLAAGNERAGDAPKRLTLTRSYKTFDWKSGRFNPPGPGTVVGTLDPTSMTLVGK